MKKHFIYILLSIGLFSACQPSKQEKSSSESNQPSPAEQVQSNQVSIPTEGLFAHIYTKKGEIVCYLETERTPLTVANFVGLAEGKIPNGFSKPGKPYYDKLTFHRVIADFMIQGGDPAGDGSGGPGYNFPDEFIPELMFNGPGILAMANAGPATNGSQFFITHKETSWLNGKHTIFGHVTKGQDVVNAIAQGDVMDSVRIERKGPNAMSFDALAVYNDKISGFKKELEERNKMDSKRMQEIPAFNTWAKKNYPSATKHSSGMYIQVTQKGTGAMAKSGQTIVAHYTGKFIDGTKFDSSLDRGQPFSFPLGAGQVIPGWDIGFANIPVGSKATFVIPYTLGYGEAGYPGNIPPKASLIFDVEFLEAR